MSSFNDKIHEEEKLYRNLVHEFDMNNLDSYCITYKNLVKSNVRISATMIDIRNVISFRKDQLISGAIEKNEIKTQADAMFYLEDIKLNRWKVSEKTKNELINLYNSLE